LLVFVDQFLVPLLLLFPFLFCDVVIISVRIRARVFSLILLAAITVDERLNLERICQTDSLETGL